MTAVLDNFNENVIGLPSNLNKQRLALRSRFAGVEEYVENAAKNVPQEMFDGLQESAVAASKDRSKPGAVGTYVRQLNDDIQKFVTNPKKEYGEQL